MRRAAAALALLCAGFAPLLAGCGVLIGTDAFIRGEPDLAAGVVFDDANGNGARDPAEPGVAGVAVSNGGDVVRTDGNGRYRIPIDDDAIIFVIKPRGWTTPVDENQLPRFYRIHKPAGSPTHLAFPGVPPTGPLPESVDFPLERRPEPDRFRAIVLADPQPHNLKEIDYFARDVIEELIGTDAAFGVTLGDVVGNDLALFEPLNRAVSRIGIPWYNVHGNHDMNFSAADDRHSDETWERIYGPTTYAFEVGAVHFIALDDVVYEGAESDGSRGRYTGGLSRRQLDFVRNYLETVPSQHLVVLGMHIPLASSPPHEVPQRRELFEILSSHPRTLSLSGHTHVQFHRFFGPDDGYRSPRAHHHLNVAAASGSWWLGEPDELGIPHATMRCGAPNGYAVITFDGHDYSVRFKAARRPADHQMNLFAPEALPAAEAGGTDVLVNVFAGSERSLVEMRLSGTDGWTRLTRTARKDPHYLELLAREAARTPPPQRHLPPAMPSPHLWVGTLPENPPRGTATLEVRTTDMFGGSFTAHRLIRFH
jgi:hypothetical protein